MSSSNPLSYRSRGWLRMSIEKQDTLLKLSVLSLTAILCKLFTVYFL